MLHPVIMCGGAGARLWPASQPGRAKPFLPLVGGESTFSQTLRRARALADVAEPLIVAGASHQPEITAALQRLGLTAKLIIEPEARDTGPAMTAAAEIVLAQDPAGVCIFLAADHHIPDFAAFSEVVRTAVEACQTGAIVTLGIRPDGPNTAYGYLRPAALTGQGDVREVGAFIEKPTAARAAELLAEGCLWNSGMFVARADCFLQEVATHAPDMAQAASQAAKTAVATDLGWELGAAFRQAPKRSIDYAVMEKTRRVVVAPATFAWSDLGAWDAVLGASAKDAAGNSVEGPAVALRSTGCLVRAQSGVKVVALGLQDVAIVATPEGVMVCALDALDSVKDAVAEIAALSAADGQA